MMKNITEEAKVIESQQKEREMPTTTEFVGAKLSKGFDFLGAKFGQGKKLVELKKDLMTTEGKLNSTLAKEIGKYVIEEATKGNSNIQIPLIYINQIRELNNEINRLQEEIKNV